MKRCWRTLDKNSRRFIQTATKLRYLTKGFDKREATSTGVYVRSTTCYSYLAEHLGALVLIFI